MNRDANRPAAQPPAHLDAVAQPAPEAASPDPIFAAIARYKLADKRHGAVCGRVDTGSEKPKLADQITFDRECDAETPALEDLIATVPTTAAGAYALIAFLATKPMRTRLGMNVAGSPFVSLAKCATLVGGGTAPSEPPAQASPILPEVAALARASGGMAASARNFAKALEDEDRLPDGDGFHRAYARTEAILDDIAFAGAETLAGLRLKVLGLKWVYGYRDGDIGEDWAERAGDTLDVRLAASIIRDLLALEIV